MKLIIILLIFLIPDTSKVDTISIKNKIILKRDTTQVVHEKLDEIIIKLKNKKK